MRQRSRLILMTVVAAIGLIYLIRLFYLQVIDTKYTMMAHDNVVEAKRLYPYRGVIMDRNDKLLVSNKPLIDIVFIPKKFELEDTLVFCKDFNIELTYFMERSAEIKKQIKAKKLSSNRTTPLISRMTVEEFSRVADKIGEIPWSLY